jgi:PIN domain nuclease of toxin-antitoxin system
LGSFEVIILDTHIWVWWVNGSNELSPQKRNVISSHETSGLGISAISCWEVAKLVEKGRLTLALPVEEWVEQAVAHRGIILIPLDPKISTASTRLPQPFHNDPADQIIVATARVLDVPLATDDAKILSYEHVALAWPS